jgi:hypothetical protein
LNPSKDELVPDGGMYARVPIPAVKYLTYSGNRPAARVLIALCMHLGKDSRVVWPGYSTIALFAYVSENNIRKILNTLVALGFISVEKKRMGKHTNNHYSILPKAYIESKRNGLSAKTMKKVESEHWICHTCYEDVELTDAEFVRRRDWEGKNDDHWRHVKCISPFSSCRLIPVCPGILADRESYRERMRLNI